MSRLFLCTVMTVALTLVSVSAQLSSSVGSCMNVATGGTNSTYTNTACVNGQCTQRTFVRKEWTMDSSMECSVDTARFPEFKLGSSCKTEYVAITFQQAEYPNGNKTLTNDTSQCVKGDDSFVD